MIFHKIPIYRTGFDSAKSKMEQAKRKNWHDFNV